jgi:hypothetical protein
MNRKSGWVVLPLLFVPFPAFLEARVPPEPPPLIKRSADPTLPPGEPDSSVLRETAVDVSIQVAREGDRVRLPLLDGTGELELVRTRRRRTRDGVVIWTGRVRGQPASTVLFSASRDLLVANISTQPNRDRDARHFEIRPVGERRHVLREIDPSKLPEERDPLTPEPVQQESQRTCSTDPDDSIDVLVFFTPRTSGKVNGPEGMRLAIEVYVEQANMSYAQSGVEQRLRLVGAEEVAYTESDKLQTDLESLKDPGGEMPDVHERRDTLGADLVALMVEYSDQKTDEIGCGQAFVMKSVSKAFERSAFAVVPRRCADKNISFAHELGHLMGARHDWAAAENESDPEEPFRFSHGFVHQTPRPAFRTVMATREDCDSGCPRVLFWSNPSVNYPPSGEAMGIASGEQPANNSRTLNTTAEKVANFRCRKP